MGKTSIQWTDFSWPVIAGCTRVSAGCMRCYAERLTATRLRHVPAYEGLAVIKNGEPHWTGDVRLNEKVLQDPLRWRKPRRIFVCEMSDLFHEKVPDEWLDRIFAVMALCPQHVFQCLTKRPERMLEYMTRLSKSIKPLQAAARAMGYTFLWEANNPVCQVPPISTLVWPIPNIWLGVSAEDQKTADERIPILLKTPTAVKWISYEPALGPLDLLQCKAVYIDAEGDMEEPSLMRHFPVGDISWLVCGGESGPHARPFDIQWARSIVEQCNAANVPCFIKQFGSAPFSVQDHISHRLNDHKGGDMSEWPEDLRVREYPEVHT